MPKIGSKKSLKKASKRIYDRTFRKAKAGVLKKSRKRAVAEIEARAEADATKKFGLTKSEKHTKRKEKIKKYAKGLKANLEGFSEDFSPEETKGKKGKGKSIWDMDLEDVF